MPNVEPVPPLRVGFVLHAMQVAGAEVLVAETVRRLAGRIEPVILCLDAVGALGERLQTQGVPVVCLDRRPGRDWGLARRMARELKRRRVEVIHAHQYTPFFYSALALPLCAFRPRLILTEHGRHFPDAVSPLRRAANRLVLRRFASAVTACCAFSGRALAEVDGFSARSVEVIENGIELGRYCPPADRAALRASLGLDPARRYVACVARFHPVKDHQTLLRGFAPVARARGDVDLLLAGDGPLRGELERSAAELGVADRVRFLGVRSDVPALLRAADVFALTSVSEAASLTVLEAMASAVPVVVTAVGGNPEMVRDGVEGLLVPRGDHAAAAAALLRLLDDAALASSLGAAGRLRVERCYLLGQTVERYWQLYQRLARPGTSAEGGVSAVIREGLKRAARGLALLAVLPLWFAFLVQRAAVGRDRAVEHFSEAVSLLPGLSGRYLRRAFLSLVLDECHPTATVCFGVLFSKAGARVGANVYVGPRCHLGLVALEPDVLLAAGVHVTSGARTHGTDDPTRPIREQQTTVTPVRIGAGAWVGSAAVVMSDVGAGTVVGAGAVVTRPLPAGVVAAGVPATVLRARDAGTVERANQEG